MKLEMRGLDPVADYELFREAYDWRKVSRLQHGRLSFETFTNPSEVTTMGLFNGEFLAVYVIEENQRGHFGMHFTSKRGTPREYLVAGGIQITNWLIENGAMEVSALITKRNRALRQFLEDCGYSLEKEMTFDDSSYTWLRFIAV